MIFNINSTRGHTGSLLVKYYFVSNSFIGATERRGRDYFDGD